jgi:hypothetical protein
MLDKHVRFLAGVFVAAENVKPSNEDVAALMPIVEGVELFPRPILETTPTGDVSRIGFISSDGAWQVMLLKERFDVARTSPNQLSGSDLGDFAEFSSTASGILEFLVERFGIRPHRLALVREGFLTEMDNDQTNELAKKLFKLPQVYENRLLSEWDWRCVSEIERTFATKTEPLNTITTIKKGAGIALQTGTGAPTIIPSKRIRFDTDINTLPRNVETRFDRPDIHDFFTKATEWHNEIESNFEHLIS